MSKDKLIPELRFPDFKNEEEWIVKKLGLLTNTAIGEFVIKTRQDPNSPYPVYNGGKSYTGFYDEYNNEANKIVISARGANAGFVNLVKQKYWAGNSCYSVEVLEQNKINLELLFYYIKHNQRRFTDNQQAANIPSVSKSDVEKFKICYPEDDLEQQKIASCLSSLDEVIAAHSQKLDLLKDHKKGLMQNLFPQEGEKVPKVRFPEFAEKGEWEEKKLGEVFSSYSGGTPSTMERDYYGGIIPFIRSGEIKRNSTELFLTEAGLNNSSAKMVEKGDLLVALYGANSGDVAISQINGAINQAILCLKSDFSNEFTYHYLFHKKDWIVKRYLQGGQGNLSGDIVKSIELIFPTEKEQQKIAFCLSSLDALITAQAEKIEQLKLHKKGMMQGMFPKSITN